MKVFILEDDPTRIRLFREAGINHDLTITTTYEEAVSKFTDATDYDTIFLDHDLGGKQFVPSDGEEKTGYHFAKWLNENVKESKAIVTIHSYNPVGAEQMYKALRDDNWPVVKIPFGPTVLRMLSS